MKRKIKDISYGTTVGDVAIQNALGDTIMDLVSELTPENINTEEVGHSLNYKSTTAYP